MDTNRTLLIVDDEPDTLRGYREFLTPSAASPGRRSSRREQGTAQDPLASLTDSEAYRLLEASTGEQAIEIVKSEIAAGRRIAAGFFDVKLGPGIDGLTTIQEIRKLDPDLHCVVVTAYHDRTVEEINKLFGEEYKDRWDYLNKPFTQGEIVQKARQMVGAWNRIRQIQSMQAQLVRSERLAAVGQVARGVGHEFGNILLRIMGKTDLSLMEKNVDKIHEHLKVVMSAAERAGVIVRNLQSFSKSEPNRQMASITDSIDQAISLISHELVKFSIQLEKAYEPVPKLRIDVGGLAQVFLNLLINAVHVLPQGGKITVRVARQKGPDGEDWVAAVVGDNGPGIPPDVLPRIFDFAFTTKGDRGSGLGLSISKEIVEAHGGRLTVKTETAKGTEFTVWIRTN